MGWRLARALLAAALLPLPGAVQQEKQDDKLNLLVVGIPLSPLHSIVAIGQELCLRGHNVTVVSFGERGEKKTRKYSPACPLRYVSMGPMPLDEETEESTMSELAQLTNDSFAFFKKATAQVFSVYIDALRVEFRRLMGTGALKADYALVSMPFGDVGQVLSEHGIDFAINVPTAALPPVVPSVASYVPVPQYSVNLYNMAFLDRFFVHSLNGLFHFGKHSASAAGFRFPLMPDFNPRLWWGKLVLVNSAPGFDYPQPMPPLVQFTGPVVDLTKMEAFPPEVETFLEETPEGTPVVYVSFGTVMFLSKERVAAMVNTLTSDSYRVLWALPKAQQPGLPAEVPKSMFVHHWIPTVRALAHPKVAAFVSHCGGNSAAEAMAWGVPVVGYPQFGDQPAVCQRIADAGAGRTRPAGSWVQAEDVLDVVTNPSYWRKAQRVSRLFRKVGGVSKAADFIELGARGDLEALRLPTERSWAAWFQMGGYETLLVWVVIAHLSAYLWLYCCRRCCGRCCGRCFGQARRRAAVAHLEEPSKVPLAS